MRYIFHLLVENAHLRVEASGSNQADVNSWYYSQEEHPVLPQGSGSTESKEIVEASPNSGAESNLKFARASKRKQKAEAKRQKREALQDSRTNASTHTPPSGSDKQLQPDSSTRSGSPLHTLTQNANQTGEFKAGFRAGPVSSPGIKRSPHI